jgi:hypothetical protein
MEMIISWIKLETRCVVASDVDQAFYDQGCRWWWRGETERGNNSISPRGGFMPLANRTMARGVTRA